MTSHQKLDTTSTISWLLMDFCWLSEYMTMGLIFSLIAIVFSISSIIVFKGDRVDKYALFASLMWVLMNSIWMYGDSLELNWLTIIAKIMFLMAIIFVAISIKSDGLFFLRKLKIK